MNGYRQEKAEKRNKAGAATKEKKTQEKARLGKLQKSRNCKQSSAPAGTCPRILRSKPEDHRRLHGDHSKNVLQEAGGRRTTTERIQIGLGRSKRKATQKSIRESDRGKGRHHNADLPFEMLGRLKRQGGNRGSGCGQSGSYSRCYGSDEQRAHPLHRCGWQVQYKESG